MYGYGIYASLTMFSFIVLQCPSLRFPFSVLAPLPSFQKDDVYCMRPFFHRAVVHLNMPFFHRAMIPVHLNKSSFYRAMVPYIATWPPFTEQWYISTCPYFNLSIPSFYRAMVHLNMPSFHGKVHLNMPSFHSKVHLNMPSFYITNGTSQHALLLKHWYISTCPPFT